MVNIELTTQHAEELKNFYVSELEKLQKRTNVIKELLSKLDTEHAHISLPETKQEKVKKTNEITSQDKTKTKNPKWSDFIIQVLQEKQKPLPRKAFTKLYERQNNVKLADSKNARTSLEQSLYKLRVKDKKIESIKGKGKKGVLYGLIEWAGKFSVKTAKEKVVKTKKDNTTAAVEIVQKTLPDFDYNWTQFIRETIISQKRILSLQELIQYAIVHFELTEEYRKAIRGNISFIISDLKQSKILKPARKEGVEGLSYGLAEWFSDDGYIKPEYNKQKKPRPHN